MNAAPGWQLGFAVAVIAGLGLAHGAGDMAVVERRRMPAFLAAYLLVAGACLAWWVASPAVALPLFFLASAVHFGLEDAPADRPGERITRGALMVAGPAVLHRTTLDAILQEATGDAAFAAPLADGLAVVGGAALAAALAIAVRRRDAVLVAGAAALTIPPPLIGFPLGFVLLHAHPQTLARMRRLSCPDLSAYLRLTAPVLAGAVLVGCAAAVLMRGAGLPSLFAGLAALAMPHMLVTPWFERRPERAGPGL